MSFLQQCMILYRWVWIFLLVYHLPNRFIRDSFQQYIHLVTRHISHLWYPLAVQLFV
jgi:hypothetical protein